MDAQITQEQDFMIFVIFGKVAQKKKYFIFGYKGKQVETTFIVPMLLRVLGVFRSQKE